jgi:hypothetical protein
MAAETIIALAIATGRTLVLPPDLSITFLHNQHGKKRFYGIQDFFPLHEMARMNIGGFDMVTMEEYLQLEGITGNLYNHTSGAVLFPPSNRTNWDKSHREDVRPLLEYLRSVAFDPVWIYHYCMVGFPIPAMPPRNVTHLQEILNKMVHHQNSISTETTALPLPVNAAIVQRLREFVVGRPEFCGYNHDMQEKKTIHLKCCDTGSERMIVHFYAFLFFEDWKEDLWMKRVIRDRGA